MSDAGAIQGTATYSAWGEPQGSAIAPFGFTGELQSNAPLPGSDSLRSLTCGADLTGLVVATRSARPDL